MDGILNLLRSLGSTRVVIMGVVLAALVGFFAYLTMQISKPPMTLLYSDLDVKDAGAITERLTAMNVPFETSRDGASIRVPEGDQARLRMVMAQDGLPSGGSVGYEIFDEGQPLGTTSFVQNVNHLRALEGELARSIQSFDSVRAARVHLVLPERRLFDRDERQPTASIVIRTQGRLDNSQVGAIQHLAASAVPGLEPNRVSIVDERGTLLAAGTENGQNQAFASNAEERRLNYETQMKSELEALLARSLGSGKVRAEVTAAIDHDRITTNSELYDPDGRVTRSERTIEETGSNSETTPDDTVTVANNLPEADIPDAGGAGGPTRSSNNSRIEETANYEISKTVRTEVKEAGSLERLSVAILVDGTYTTTEDGTRTYQPRSQQELDQIETLVKSAIGYDQQRGDIVDVVNMQFAEVESIEPAAEPTMLFGMDRGDFFRLAQLVVLAVVAALVILLVVRPLLVRILESLPAPQPSPAGALPGGGQAALPAAGGYDGGGNATSGGELTYQGQFSGSDLVPQNTGASGSNSIDVASIDSKLQESAVNKVGEVVSRHPDEAAAILRNWLYNE